MTGIKLQLIVPEDTASEVYGTPKTGDLISNDDSSFATNSLSIMSKNFSQHGPYLKAVHLQVMGACRADERLKPSPKHFEASGVGLVARFLCVPLVSMHEGKLIKGRCCAQLP